MSTTRHPPSIDDVRSFWEESPCGHETAGAEDRLAYFLGIERYRYETAPYIREVARFEGLAGKRVLEIGCGLGTDGAQFARAGAEYLGVDLTDSAVRLAAENFAVRGLAGEFRTVNAESLPFPPESFDHVYSFGVIHHTEHPAAVVEQIRDVLKPGGTVMVMLYNRTSINYYVEIMFLRKVGRVLLRPQWAPRLFASMLGLPRDKLTRHRELALRIPRPTKEQWVSMNTDGPDCPLSRVYSATEAKSLFSSFTDVRTEVRGFDRSHWPVLGQLIPGKLADGIGRRYGWSRIVYARKPAT